MSSNLTIDLRSVYELYLKLFFSDTAYKMFREGEGREIVKLLREAESSAIDKEKIAQQEAVICNDKIKQRNQIKVIFPSDDIDYLTILTISQILT